MVYKVAIVISVGSLIELLEAIVCGKEAV